MSPAAGTGISDGTLAASSRSAHGLAQHDNPKTLVREHALHRCLYRGLSRLCAKRMQ